MGEGDAVTAECLIKAQPPATRLAWTLDGKLMEGKSSTMMVRSSLCNVHQYIPFPLQVLPSVGSNLDGASLACEATNSLGDGNASLTLNVLCKYFPQ